MDDLGIVTALPQREAFILLTQTKKQGDCDGIPVHAENSDDYVDARDVNTSIVGHCEEFNLHLEEDRERYADLLSRLSAESNLVLHFEDRQFVDGQLICYIAYVEYVKIVK